MATMATDSAQDLRAAIGEDATATFESDPKFVDGDATQTASSKNVAVQHSAETAGSGLTGAAEDLDEEEDADLDDEDDEDEYEDDEDDELEDDDEEDNEELDDEDDTEAEVAETSEDKKDRVANAALRM